MVFRRFDCRRFGLSPFWLYSLVTTHLDLEALNTISQLTAKLIITSIQWNSRRPHSGRK